MSFSEEKFRESYVSLEGATPDEFIATGAYKSHGDIRRLAQQGAIKIDGLKVDEESLFGAMPTTDSIVTVGKRAAYRIVSSETAE